MNPRRKKAEMGDEGNSWHSERNTKTELDLFRGLRRFLFWYKLVYSTKNVFNVVHLQLFRVVDVDINSAEYSLLLEYINCIRMSKRLLSQICMVIQLATKCNSMHLCDKQTTICYNICDYLMVLRSLFCPNHTRFSYTATEDRWRCRMTNCQNVGNRKGCSLIRENLCGIF